MEKISFAYIKFLFLLILSPLTAITQTIHSIAAFPFVGGKEAVMRFEFSQDKVTLPTEQFGIVFPEEFSLKSVLFADSQTLNGGFYVKVKKDTVYVHRSGVGDSVKANTQLGILLATVILPEDLEKPYLFRFICQDSGKRTVVDIRSRIINLEGR